MKNSKLNFALYSLIFRFALVLVVSLLFILIPARVTVTGEGKLSFTTGDAVVYASQSTETRQPDGDISTGAWTTAPLWSKIDEGSASPDGIYIVSPDDTNTTGECSVQDPTVDDTYTEVRVKVYARKSASGGNKRGLDADIRINNILQGQQRLASNLGSSFDEYDYTWTGLSFSQSDMNSLQVLFISTGKTTGASLREVHIDYYEVIVTSGFPPPVTRYVDDDYDASTPGWGVTHFATISTAIGASSAGDTISVAAGTYTENVELDKQLTLTGDVTQPSNVVVDAGGSGTAIALTASNSVLRGFQAQNGRYGIHVDTSNDSTLSNNIVISNSTYAIYVDGSINGTFTDNTITGNATYGIIVERSYDSTFTGNTVTEDGTSAIFLDNSDNSTFTGNTVTGNGTYGINLTTSSHNSTFTKNIITGNATYGINLGSSSDNNTFAGNKVTGFTDIGIRIEASVNASTISIQVNSIYSNTNYGVKNEAATTASATNNWWGDNDGPSGEGSAWGDAVSANVSYNPWLVLTLTATPKSILAGGSSNTTIITADMTLNSDTGDTSGLGYIPDGTVVNFTTNKGSYSANTTTSTNTTTSGVTNTILTSSTTVEVATLTASAPPHTTVATTFSAALFTQRGVTITDYKEERLGAGTTLDAKTEADTEVEKSGTGRPTVTAARYSGNPAGKTSFGPVSPYVDVYLNSTDNVDEIEIRIYYTAASTYRLAESLLRPVWWNGTFWGYCRPGGVNATDTDGYSGYVWTIITSTSTPSLDVLTGTPFSASYPQMVGGEVYPVDKAGVLALWAGLALLSILSISGGILALRRRGG